MNTDPRAHSRIMVDGPGRAPARSYFKSVGLSSEDLKKPLVMVAHSWIGTMPCNFNQRELAQEVMAGVRAAGGTPMEVNTISISDGISMGTEGMKASLISREVIADSIELAAIGYSFDAVVVIVGCDKTIPAAAMVLARLNLPGVVLYSGSIAPGRYRGQDIYHPGRVRRGGPAGSGVHQRGRARGDRGCGLSGGRGMRSPVHGQHDGHGHGVPRPFAHGERDRRGHRPAQGERGLPRGRAGDGRVEPGRAAARHPDAEGV